MITRLTLAFDRLLSAFLLERYDEVRLRASEMKSSSDREAGSYFLARTFLNGGDLEGATSHAKSLPGSSSLRVEIEGRIALAKKNYEEAATLFQALQKDMITRWLGLTLTAAILAEQEKFLEAWPLLVESFELKWNDPETMSGLITVGNRIGKFQELEPLLHKFLYRSPADMDVRSHYALALMGQGKIEEATLEVLRILAFDADHPIAVELHGTLVTGGFL